MTIARPLSLIASIVIVTIGCNTGSRDEPGSTTAGATAGAPPPASSGPAPTNSSTNAPTGGPATSAPTIDALLSDAGPEDAPILIRGAQFGGTQGASTISVGGIPVTEYLTWSGTEVQVLVPAGATSGMLTITTPLGSASRPFTVAGAVHYVAPTGQASNPGTRGAPLASIGAALAKAVPGDVVVVRGGDYTEGGLATQRDGSAGARIVLAGYPGEAAVIKGTTGSHALEVRHDWITVQGIEVDGGFSSRDGIRTTNASNLVIRNCRIYNAGATVNNGAGDGIDIEGGTDILVEGCEIFDCLSGSFAVQQDSHGIVAGNFNRVTIRRCKIYRCSGDAVQFDPDRDPWDNMLIEDCELFTEALPAPKASWAAGQIPGENAVDTKADPSALGQSFVIRDSVIHGFSSAWISNMAALNIKNDVTGTIERCVIYDNVIAFRMRAPATNVVIKNCLTYDNEIAVRYEDGIQGLQLLHCTIVDNSNRTFQNGGGGGLGGGFVVQNCLFEGAVPSEASDPSNQSATAATFVDAAARNYRLQPLSGAVDTAAPSSVAVDLDRAARPSGSGPDVGAYER